ncbi:iron complex outermembrane receptor protein [Pararhizobium capsulatum DSM 1112]|uniref:Iron complex outermembrane receptor protein n=1 Tax=Pararhizobium capsulatum DSM 1112 TaxID=1121113 RepID=A0ABU0BJW2_9HYPH|nr:TonB-dependent siderophore receptor [Pararhizobium capsulatum]MDQ0318538.1 iron complex outermembrane receptor protein [Pararhizobium capsulatum DSM 1112]
MRIKGTGLNRFLMAGVSLAAVTMTGVAMPVSAFAQDAASGGATALERLSVEGGKVTQKEAKGPVDGYVAKATDTGSKAAMTISEIPQSVSVIGRQELDDRGVVTKVDEALRYTPGVTSEPFGSDPDTDWYYIRGFDATQTGVFLDGLNLYSFSFGGFQTDAFMLERVEVLKGPASVLYGGSNPGGIVDLVRKRPQDEPLYYTEIGINNFGNAFFGFDANDKLNADGTINYRITGKIAGGDNYSDYSEDLRGFVMPQITYTPDDATSLTVYAIISALDQTHVGNGFLPYEGTVTSTPFGKIDRDVFPGEPDHDYGRYDQQMIGYEFEHEFDNGWKVSQNARYAHLDKKELIYYPYGWLNTTDPASDNYYKLYRVGFNHDTSADSFNIDNRAEKDFDTGPVKHSFLAGIDYKYYQIDQTQASPFWMTPATPIDPFNPIYDLPQPDNLTYRDDVTTMQQIGIYAQDQMRFGDGWLLTLNGRYDYVDIEDDAKVGTSYSTHDGALSGRAGLAYEFANGVTPYVSAATFFNPLIGTVYGGGAMKPEEGHQIEGGIKYEPTFIDGLLTASVYHIVKQNVSLTRPLDFLQEQIGEVTSTGIELEGKINLNEKWKLLASYSYNDLEVTEDLNPALIGKRPYLIPEQHAALWLDYTLTEGALEGVSIGGGLRYQGKSYADNLNTLTVPDALLADAAVRYEKDGWRASLNVANLFDKEYVKGCQGASTCGYGDQRTVTLKLSKTL